MSRKRRERSLPGPVREAIGGAVLVGSVRTIDALWHRIAGRPTPLEARAAREDAAAADTSAGEPAVVRDRLVYALLLRGAARLAERAGLTKQPPAQRTMSRTEDDAT